jgi:hypothetical protein
MDPLGDIMGTSAGPKRNNNKTLTVEDTFKTITGIFSLQN